MRISSCYTSNIFQSTLPTRGSDKLLHRAERVDIISIHAPHEGERPDTGLGSAQPIRFQSTLPTRGSDSFALAYLGGML